MPADYDQIRDENIARYGWDTAVLELLGQLYSERSHFIFELIQNAEDAGATEMTFELCQDRLEVRHDGRPFTPADVRGICGVGQSSKADDLTQIGKFGIGFKAVYAYTDSPQIYSAAENFRIEKYVRPYPVRPAGEPAGTVFVFPFDRADVPPALAVREISAALTGLHAETLLFLRSVERIRVCGQATADVRHERTGVARSRSMRQVRLVSRGADGPSTEDWLIWQRPLDALGQADLRVEIAFTLRADIDARRVVRRESSPLVVSFPTQKETFLGFLIQGPYRTTPARDNVPDQDEWNQSLAGETATLLTDVLGELAGEGLLTADILQALPLDASRFGPATMLRPLFDSTRSALAEGELIPVDPGGYRSARQLRLASGAGLRELLTPELLGELVGEPDPVAFVHDSVSEAGTPLLWRYLREEIAIPEVTPRSALAAMDGGFLTARADQWIGRLYRFLDQNHDLWREPRQPGEQPGVARSSPIIRLEDGTQVAPFDPRGRPAAYLPGPVPSSFATVRRTVADLPGARQFLTSLGYAEPDIVAEVLDRVLPRYDKADVAHLDPAEHEADLELIARALAEAPQAGRARISEQLQLTTFLVAENAATGEHRLMRPGELYLRTTPLEGYFAGNPDAWLGADSYGPWLAQLREMGVRDAAAVSARRPDELGHVLVAEDFAWHERGVAGFDPAAQIDGLEYALAHPNAARSEYVWNALLVPNRHLIAGVVETSHRMEYADARPGGGAVADRNSGGCGGLAAGRRRDVQSPGRPGRRAAAARLPAGRRRRQGTRHGTAGDRGGEPSAWLAAGFPAQAEHASRPGRGDRAGTHRSQWRGRAAASGGRKQRAADLVGLGCAATRCRSGAGHAAGTRGG